MTMSGRSAALSLVAGLLAMASTTASAQSAEQFAAHASTAVDRLQPFESVFKAANIDAWMRSVLTFSDVKYDVVKTDSVLSPVVGKVSLTYTLTGTSRQPDEASARSAPLSPASSTVAKCEFNYVPTSSGWDYLSGRCNGFDVKRERVYATPAPGKNLGPDVRAARAFMIPTPAQ